jgi:nucleotide-binding universal stress UspA family protein
MVDPSGALPLGYGLLAAREQGEAVLDAALDRATAVASELAISTGLLHGAPGQRLLDVCEDAALLVVARRARLHRQLGCSAIGGIAPLVRCPVVVVRRRPDVSHDQRGPRVVVGVSLCERSTAVLDLAFSAAAQRDVPLVALHACRSDVPADLEGVCGAPAAIEDRPQEQLERLLVDWRGRFPSVLVQTRVLSADPVTALVQESTGASLLVVGAGKGGVVQAALLGSVSRSLVRRARVPLALHPDPAGHTRQQRAPSRGNAYIDPFLRPTRRWQ